MKKLFTLGTAFIFSAMFAFADQAKAQSPLNFGVKGGVNITNISGPGDSPDSRTGILAGIVVDISLPAVPLGVETGLYYSQKGAESEEMGATMSTNLDYLEVPVLAKLSIGPPGPFTPHILAGPYLAFNINAEDDFEGQTTDISDSINSTDFGGVVGVGADFSLGLTTLNAQARYSFGLTSVFDSDMVQDDYKNRAITLSVGIMF